MVATTDCIEESKPIVGKKVRGKNLLEGGGSVYRSQNHSRSGRIVDLTCFSPTGVQTNHGEEKKSSHKQEFGPVKISTGELLQHQCEYADSNSAIFFF